MKSRSLFSTLNIVIISIILIAIGSLFWVFKSKPIILLKGGVKTNPQATVFISKQAPAMFSLLVNPDKVSKFSQLVSDGGKRRQVKREIEQIRDNFLTKTNLNYEEDLQPWLGDEVTFAVTSLDYDRNAENGVQPGYLLVVKNKDSQLAKEFLQVSYTQEGISDDVELTFDSYKGVNLIYQRPLNPQVKVPKLATAVVGDFVLFANDIKVLKEAINNVQAIGLNLAHHQPYREAISTITKPKISLGYLNIPAFSAWIGNSNSPESKLNQETLTLSISVNPEGLITNTALFGIKSTENQLPKLSNVPTSLNYIPSNSVLSAAGVNLKEFWQDITTGLPENSPIKQIVNQGIQPIEKSLNINLVEDIFNNVEKEYAVALVSNPQQPKKLDWVFVNQKEDSDLINKLDALASQQDLSVGKLPLSDQTITAWTKLITTSENDFTTLKAEVKGVHIDLDEYDVLSNSVDILNNIIRHPNDSLKNSTKFEQAIAALPNENDGYLYIDWHNFEPIIAQKFPIIRVAELAFKPLFDNLNSLTITGEGTKNGVRQAAVFWRF